jgi:hypothetical protein
MFIVKQNKTKTNLKSNFYGTVVSVSLNKTKTNWEKKQGCDKKIIKITEFIGSQL